MILKKGDAIIITKINDFVFSDRYNFIGSIAKITSIKENGSLYLEFPEFNNLHQQCLYNNIEYILIKNKNKNIVKDLYKKAKIGGFVYASK